MKREAEREAVKRQVAAQIDLSRTMLNGLEVILLGNYLKERLTGPYDIRSHGRELEETRAIAVPYKIAARAQVHLSQSSALSSLAATEPLDRALAANLSTLGKSALAVDTRSVSSVLAEASRVIDTVSLAEVEQLTILGPDEDGGGAPRGEGGGDQGGGGAPPPPSREPSPGPEGALDMSFEQFPVEIQEASRAAFSGLPIGPIVDDAISVAQSGGGVDIGQVNAAITSMVAGAAATIGGPIGAALVALAFILLPRMLTEIEDELIGFDL
jgi:hypothetical protein